MNNKTASSSRMEIAGCRVAFVASLTPALLQEYRERNETFIVLLALRIDSSFTMASAAVAVIDLMCSRIYGSFPDDEHKNLFHSFFTAADSTPPRHTATHGWR